MSNKISEAIADHFFSCNLNIQDKILHGSDKISEYYICTKCNQIVIRID